ncbi:Signal recognition particle subunit SRP72 [Elasticomyces elasticus]|nr:Signal recognition particle subunit SRP72 [Elasticomyces elasticus]
MTSALSSATSTISTLLGQTSLDDHEETLRAADKALKKSKTDTEAQHVKLVALLKLDRFDDALHVLKQGGDKLKERARLEWAYALYKAGKPEEAAEIAKDATERGLQHVEAQATYRAENFIRASAVYQQLSSDQVQAKNEEADLRINSGAVDAQLEWAGFDRPTRSKKPRREDLDAFETAYNAACGSIARGELGQGEVLLRRAKDLCNALEDLSEADKQAELLPLAVQHVYVLARQGRLDEAEKLASDIPMQEIPDPSTRYIAQINSLASRPKSNPFLTHRLFNSAPTFSQADQLFQYQQSIIRQDSFAIDLESLKHEGVAAATSREINSQSLPSLQYSLNSLSILNVAARARSESGKTALKQIVPLLEKRPNDIGLILTIVQLYVLTGNLGSATQLLEKFLSKLEQSGNDSHLNARFASGLVGTLVSLYVSQGQRSHLRTELAKAASYWRKRTKESSSSFTQPVHALKAAGSALLESSIPGDLSLAKAIFSDLHAQDAGDRYSTAGLVASLTFESPSEITATQLDALTPVERLVTSIDASALEAAGVARASAPTSTNTKRAAPETKASRPKKMKKSRIPKDYDPNKTADPERWLPMKDRSYYRPKGKKGKQRQAQLMQGGVVAEETSRPATPGGEGSRPGATVAAGGVISGGGGAGAGQAKKKKKGKGGKW